MAMPMTLLNGCQIHPAEAVPAVNTVAERKSEQGQMVPLEQTVPGVPAGYSCANRQRSRFSWFHRHDCQIAESKSGRSYGIRNRGYGEDGCLRFKKDIVKNGQTVVLKPNLVQMIVDSMGELLDQEVKGLRWTGVLQRPS